MIYTHCPLYLAFIRPIGTSYYHHIHSTTHRNRLFSSSTINSSPAPLRGDQHPSYADDVPDADGYYAENDPYIFSLGRFGHSILSSTLNIPPYKTEFGGLTESLKL